MKNYIHYIPLTAFAAVTLLGSSLSANEIAPNGNRPGDAQVRSQVSVRNADGTTSTHQVRSQPMKASELLGMNIDNVSNEKIGEIDEIFIHSGSGEVLAMVVSTGGFLGMGQQQTLLSPEDLRFNGDRTLMQTELSKEQLGTSPRYEKGENTGLERVRPLTRNDINRNERSERANRNEAVQTQNHGLSVSELIGMSVENRQGEDIGKVDEVFLDLDKREVVGVLVSTGGFLGMGDRKNLFGLNEMTFDLENKKVFLDYNRDQLLVIPEFKQDVQSVFEDLRERMDRLAPRGDRNNARHQINSVRMEAQTETRNLGRSAERTVFDQGNSTEEIDMTASIRKAIRDNDTLSSRANNVTIITRSDKVVIRGEVDSSAEKTAVEGIAHAKAGRQNVTSELTVRAR